MVDSVTARFDFQVWILWFFVWLANACKILNDSVSRFLVKSLDITLFADLEWCGNVTLEERKIKLLMHLSGIIPIFTERRDEGDKANLAGHRK